MWVSTRKQKKAPALDSDPINANAGRKKKKERKKERAHTRSVAVPKWTDNKKKDGEPQRRLRCCSTFPSPITG